MNLLQTVSGEWERRPGSDYRLQVGGYVADAWTLAFDSFWVVQHAGLAVGNGVADTPEVARADAEQAILSHSLQGHGVALYALSLVGCHATNRIELPLPSYAVGVLDGIAGAFNEPYDEHTRVPTMTFRLAQ
ncbi:hypothetical protein NONI108955_11210 [Nocardia ninae]|uniref:Uncharacterized protein n=1 Tax=Nocardia ninae NBRC 108245 TaxID=1210091 RepID=A0A511MMT8_9NOCA|nr:hypothetical protein [Nocardia ninae]GEM41932.1 hypothetical protein NN4_64510 [Nocardia ninae NBRC 108245]